MSNEGKTRAELIAEATGKSSNGSGLWKKLLVVILPIIIIAGGIFVFMQNNKEADFGNVVKAPQGVVDNVGYMVGQDGKLTTEAKNSKGEKVDKVVVYMDYNCVYCMTFEKENEPKLDTLREQGEIVVEYRTVAFLDGMSATNYSSRSANAAACVVNNDPNLFKKYSTELFNNQASQENGGKEPANADLNKIAVGVGSADISACIKDGIHRPWVEEITKKAVDAGIAGTPTILVNDAKWDPNVQPDLLAFIESKSINKK